MEIKINLERRDKKLLDRILNILEREMEGLEIYNLNLWFQWNNAESEPEKREVFSKKKRKMETELEKAKEGILLIERIRSLADEVR